MSILGRRWIQVTSVILGLALGSLAPAPLSAQFGDRDTLKKKVQRLVTFLELPSRRRAAVEGLLRIGSPSVPALTRALSDPRPEVVFRCLHLLRQLGSSAKAALPRLMKMSKGEDPRLAEAARWAMLGIKPTGSFLTVDIGKHCVREIDPDGTVRVVYDSKGVYDAQRLPNGNLLVAYVFGRVDEIDKDEKVIWKHVGMKAAISVERLVDGNTLISTGKGKQVIEVDPKGKVVWKFASKWPNHADRLPSGNTLVSDYQERKLVEVDPAGKVVWEVKTPAGTIDAERLNNGNTLMVLNDNKLVVEVDPTGKTLREFKQHTVPKCAIRLPDGNTVISGKGGLLNVDPAGKKVWEHQDKTWGAVSTIRRLGSRDD